MIIGRVFRCVTLDESRDGCTVAIRRFASVQRRTHLAAGTRSSAIGIRSMGGYTRKLCAVFMLTTSEKRCSVSIGMLPAAFLPARICSALCPAALQNAGASGGASVRNRQAGDADYSGSDIEDAEIRCAGCDAALYGQQIRAGTADYQSGRTGQSLISRGLAASGASAFHHSPTACDRGLQPEDS